MISNRITNNNEFKDVYESYKQSKRFIEFANKEKGVFHDSAVMTEEVAVRKKLIFNFECSMALLDDDYRDILQKEINNEDSLWYVGVISRSTFYRNRQKAIEIFLHNFHRLETLQ